MFRRFVVVSGVFVAMCVVLSSSAVMAQSKEDAIRLHKEAYALQEKAQSHADLKQAEEKFLQAISIYQKVGERSRLAYACNSVGLLYAAWGQYDRAVDCYEKSLAISRELKDRYGEANFLNNLGIVYNDWDQDDKAVEFYEKSLAIFRELKNHKGEGSTLNELGIVYAKWGQYDKAAGQFASALTIFRELKDRKDEGSTLNNLGIVYKNWGQYDKAVEYYEKSLAINRELKNPRGEAISLHTLADVYAKLGQYEKAEDFYKNALALYQTVGDRLNQGRVSMSLGLVQQERQEGKQALENFKKGLAIWTEIKVPTRWPKSFIADTYMDTGDLANAEPLLREVNYNRSWGRFYMLKADYPKAKEYYGKVLKSAEQNRNADNLFTAYTGIGAACEGLNEYASAAEHYEKAVKFTEEIRSSLSAAEREKFFDVKINGFTRTAPYEGLARVQMRQNKPQDAFRTTEYTRARVFAEAMTRLSQGKNPAVPPEIVKQDDSLNNELSALKKNLQKAYEKNNKLVIQSLEPQVKQMEDKLQSHIKMLREKYPLFAATKYPQPMDLSQTGLKDNEWVLSYDVGDPGLIIYLTRAKTLVQSLFKAVPRKEVDDLVRKFREPLEVKEGAPIRNQLKKFDFASGKKLADILLGDVLSLLPKDAPVIVVPGGSLGIVPFEMLVLNDAGKVAVDKEKPYATGCEFFGDRNPISYYQSVTALTLARTLGKQKSSAQKSLVMDDPIFDINDSRLKQLARDQRQATIAAAPDKLLSAIKQEWKNEMIFPRLEGTRDLGDALKKMGPVKTEEYRDMQASKSLLFEKPLDRYNSMVFATHGYFGKDLPGIMEPVLVLTLVNQPAGKDGFLRLSEVMGLKLNADIVALTACQTGLGHHISGEGTMGMGRAFQYAGAKSVLMSLWSVSEASSVKLVESFFRHLKEGKNKLEALKMARDEIRKTGYDHPFYWAPFILVGEVN